MSLASTRRSRLISPTTRIICSVRQQCLPVATPVLTLNIVIDVRRQMLMTWYLLKRQGYGLIQKHM
jgi:hypothetical protein